MELIIAADYDEMSRLAADKIAAQLKAKPDCVLGLATGSTPIGLYAQLVSDCKAGDISFADATTFNLDEYRGLAPDHNQSYRYFMQDNLFERDVDPVDAVMERQASISDELTPQERLWLSKNHTVRVGVDPDFYPLEKFDAERRYTGIGPDYLRILHKMTGLSFRIAPPSDWTNTIDMATSHKVDMYIAAAETQHRSQYMLFTPSYIVLPGIIVTRQPTKGESVTRGAATDETEPSIDGLKDLAGKRVAVVNRYSWHDFLEELHPEITPVPVKNTLEGLQKVAFGEVDAMIDYQFNITEKINNSGIRNLRAAGSIDAPYGHAFGIRKDWPELHSIINKALSKITPEERRIIAQKWLQPYEKKAFSKQTIWMMLFAAEVLFTVFAFVLYWNFSLKRQVSRRTAQLNQELAKYDRAEKELRESRAMLEQSNVELEHRVNERTRDLQAINAELQLAKEAADAHKDVFSFVKETLGDAVSEVKPAVRLKSHPVCLTAGEGLSFEMEKYFQMMQPESGIKAQRILELNTEHPVFAALEAAVTADPEKAKKYARLLYDQALLIAGLPLDDPSGYTDLVCDLMK